MILSFLVLSNNKSKERAIQTFYLQSIAFSTDNINVGALFNHLISTCLKNNKGHTTTAITVSTNELFELLKDRLDKYFPIINSRLTAMRVPSITATRFTFTARLHVLAPSDVSL
jgi:single-stranded DNA-specific DHH superfamily exonuclease